MTTKISFYTFVLSLLLQFSNAQDVQLHVSPRWKECSFQLDPSLTQKEWHEFTQEAGLVACFRPLSSARSMGAGRFELSLLQWKTTIDETKGAWNNTFVHPHAEHYLVGGPALPIPGLAARVGLTSKIDAGLYWTLSPGANYGFLGGQVQYRMLEAEKHKIDLSSRLGVNAIYGPEDVNLQVYNLEALVSKKFTFKQNWMWISPYAGCSGYLTHAHEKTDRVNLKDENIVGFQGMAGAVLNVRNFSIAAEYNLARVNTLSFKLGYNFRIWQPKNK